MMTDLSLDTKHDDLEQQLQVSVLTLYWCGIYNDTFATKRFKFTELMTYTSAEQK